ncbi:MAG: cupin domain-containing protein [Gammaproteobacteria bacterium]|nr:cupin domain-containing protein [Gammaproteobacteria bacterium]MDH3371605.1 cupin domain-containing protein [Gammaproteobacteria bacterium]MDH3406535.1 cupin domain-containing protein [Gammaproteobacteria bacterium]MDH3562312.1 cupin domain-containing protein [Gammaproteobacteria bacterium]MDH5488005.1 cupin domain-containing protein [Gammaproteobacteria bacterium]
MKNITSIIFATLMSAVNLLPAGATEWIGPDEKVPEKYHRMNLEKLLDENKSPVGENIKALTIVRSERSSSLLVQVRDREPLHLHADSDITVFLLRGEGDIWLGKHSIAVKTGDIMHIPRGVVHAYINRGADPAVAFVVYSPAPGPRDRVLVEEKNN